MHSYIHTYMNAYIHAYMHAFIHTYMNAYIYIHIYIHTYTYIYTYVYIHTYIHIYIQACIHTYRHTYVHTYFYIHTYSHTSKEALCILTGLTPIAIKIEETIQFYEYVRGSTREKTLVDSDMEVKYWHHPAETITFITEDNEETSTIRIFIDESKSEQGVGAGIVIFKSGQLINSLKYSLNKRCTNNQAEQLSILRALEFRANIETEDKTATIYTDSRIPLDSLTNSNIHTYIIEVIRRKVAEMGEIKWKIQFCCIKAHAGIQGNEIADTLAK